MVKEQKMKLTAAPQEQSDTILVQVWKMLSVYAQATGVVVYVFDHNYLPIQNDSPKPCNEMHVNAIRQAVEKGGSYVYTCEEGRMCWASPVYHDGVFIGAAIGSSPGDEERIKALAEIMFLCIESISADSENYYETMRRRAEQQADLSARINELQSRYSNTDQAPGYPLDKERMLLSSLRRGDAETAQRILNELLAVLLYSYPNNFKYIQFRAIELVVLITRADINPGYTERTVLETNNYYLKQIQDAAAVEELIDILHITVERMAGQIFSFQGVRHASALRKAERFIWENYTRKISLEEIAGVSGLSPPYFSTIFKEEMGENLSSYLNRLRVEKASHLLLETELTLSDIAGSCGFEDQSWFSKIFKTFTGTSPGKYRSQGGSMVKEISENNFSDDFKTLINK
ncbi:MAG: helix-turn-helix domain-containing protein [Treponema sp.]|jgi:YesN/AraC family two-component response regulator|nr:helix-turn-helix domain-containing protein [Treponema sp.]